MTKLQERILEIFKYVDEICRENKIRYYAIGGTCLGAVRHNGFIPWDDDMDIAMPRPDFDRFFEIAPEKLPHHLKVIAKRDAAIYGNFFYKVHDITSTFVEQKDENTPARYKGVYIDVMPMDGLPGNYIIRTFHFLKLRVNGKLNYIRIYGLKPEEVGNWFWMLIKRETERHPYYYYFERRESLLKKYSFDTSRYSCYGWSRRCRKIMFLVKDFSEYVLVPFEDFQMRCPKGYGRFLTIMFGDYMKLPPEEKRNGHAMFVDLEKSYKYYQKYGFIIKESEGNG
ncbi:MAG: LicD family protein [Lachnospiraceae bacterium]|nr:LicD family protein [Lachnospiraceae bacterium]